MTMPQVVSGLLHNSFLQGAGLVGVGGSAMVYLKSLPPQLLSKVQNKLYRRAIIPQRGNDVLFNGILNYIYNKKLTSIHAVTCTPEWKKKMISGITPSPRDIRYSFRYKNRKITAMIEFKGDVKSDSKDKEFILQKDEPLSVQFSSHFLSVKDIQEFIQTEILDHINSQFVVTKNPSIKKYSDGWWSHQCYTDTRMLLSLVFNDETLGTDLLTDVETFLKDYEWYCDRSIPHRRGYLLYGEPGNGKTSLIRSIASTIGYNIAPINLSTVSDLQLTNMLAELPTDTIIVFEDIDSMFFNIKNLAARVGLADAIESASKDDKKDMTGLNGLTFSGLLNALDGLTVSKNRIVFMTTNHIDQLDPALIRPGRCDKQIYIGNPTKKTIERLYQQFFPTDSIEQRQFFVDQFDDGKQSSSFIQEKLLALRHVTRPAKPKLELISHHENSVETNRHGYSSSEVLRALGL